MQMLTLVESEKDKVKLKREKNLFPEKEREREEKVCKCACKCKCDVIQFFYRGKMKTRDRQNIHVRDEPGEKVGGGNRDNPLQVKQSIGCNLNFAKSLIYNSSYSQLCK